MTGKLLRWGNSFGIRISKADAERLGVPGTEIIVRAATTPGKVDLSHIRFLDLGGDLSTRHDEYLADTDDQEYPRNAPKRRRGAK